MTVSREMNDREIRVLNAIVNTASYDLPIQASELRNMLGLSKRHLEEVIESLRVNFRHPIVAKKNKAKRLLSATERGGETGWSGSLSQADIDRAEESSSGREC